MNHIELVPIVLFVCIAYAIKVCVDAMVRRHMVNAGGSEELVNSLLRDEEQRRRHSSLRWGIVLVSIALGLGLIQWFGWEEVTPGLSPCWPVRRVWATWRFTRSRASSKVDSVRLCGTES
jgi:hypothetical protein